MPRRSSRSPSTPSNARVELIRAYPELLQRVPRRAGAQREDREDVLQDACERILADPARTPIKNVAWYLLRCARNLLIDRHRRWLRTRQLFQPENDGIATAATNLDPERVVTAQERLAIVAIAMAALPPRCGEALRLHRFDGLSYAQIARHMGISSSMVEKHIADGMRRLHLALECADSVDRTD